MSPSELWQGVLVSDGRRKHAASGVMFASGAAVGTEHLRSPCYHQHILLTIAVSRSPLIVEPPNTQTPLEGCKRGMPLTIARKRAPRYRCAQGATVSGSNITIHSPEGLRPRHAHRSGVKCSARRKIRPSGERLYETCSTSQSVQLKPRAGSDRQPASNQVNTRLLELPVRRHRISRGSPVEQ